MRGGADVDGATRASSILNHPIEYAYILVHAALYCFRPACFCDHALRFVNLGVLGFDGFVVYAAVYIFFYGVAALLDTN